MMNTDISVIIDELNARLANLASLTPLLPPDPPKFDFDFAISEINNQLNQVEQKTE